MIDTTEIQSFIGEQYKHINAYKVEKFKTINKFLKTYNLTRLNHKEIENLNRSMASKEIIICNQNIPV